MADSALDALKQQMQQQMEDLQQKIKELEAARTSAPSVTVQAAALWPILPVGRQGQEDN